MNSRDIARASRYLQEILRFVNSDPEIPAIRHAFAETLSKQIVDSLRREEYVAALTTRPIQVVVTDPDSSAFDPIKASISLLRMGDIDEAAWLIFLATHFGKHREDSWALCQAVYGRSGGIGSWSWSAVNNSPTDFLQWLSYNHVALKASVSIRRRFGNHRKYESLAPSGTGATISSYCGWVNHFGGHAEMFEWALSDSQTCGFDRLYQSMSHVYRFGRTARFDYLTMLSKTGITSLEPSSAYLRGATGPLTGARLLLGDQHTINTLEEKLARFGSQLSIGMQCIEDSLCNWQKSPNRYCRFSG